MTEPDSPLAVDLARLDEVTGGDREFTLELVDLFLSDTRETLDRLAEAVAGRQRDALRREAHKMKGSAGNIGATRLAQFARELEQGATADLPDRLDQSHAALRAEFERAAAELTQYLEVLRNPQ